MIRMQLLLGAGRDASLHADQHGQPGIDVQESRAMEGGGRAGGASDGDEKEGAGRGASFHADQHGQPCLHLEKAGPRCGGPQFNGGMCTAADADPRRRSSPYFVFLCSIDRLAD
jgi:hypothetical protein